jgi:hypothetical protein
MSISNVNLRKQIGDLLGFGKNKLESCTQEDIDLKTKKCEDLFEKLHYCVQRHGWNDNHCQVTVKPKYDRCIIKRVRKYIQFIFEG